MFETVPDHHSDTYYLRTGPWGVAITFSLASPKEGIDDKDVCVIRISHETAKALSMMLRKQLKQYEKDSRTLITIPEPVMKNLGLEPYEW